MSALDQILTVGVVKIEHPNLHKQAAAELAAIRAERDALREAIKAAQIQLQATQINWQEECLFECNDIMTAALKGDA